jgi:hypothetical protein
MARTAKAIAVQTLDAHGKGGVAVGFFAVHDLPCVHARQRLCRAFRRLCRAMCRTAKPGFPVVTYLAVLDIGQRLRHRLSATSKVKLANQDGVGFSDGEKGVSAPTT